MMTPTATPTPIPAEAPAERPDVPGVPDDLDESDKSSDFDESDDSEESGATEELVEVADGLLDLSIAVGKEVADAVDVILDEKIGCFILSVSPPSAFGLVSQATPMFDITMLPPLAFNRPCNQGDGHKQFPRTTDPFFALMQVLHFFQYFSKAPSFAVQ